MAIRRCVLMLLAMAALHTRGAAFLLPVFGRKCFSGRICSTEERRQQSLVKMQDASWTPLHRAAQKGNLEMGRLLLCDKKTSVDVRTDEGISPLYVALENGYFSFAQLLIENGADINAQTLKGRTLLHMGAARGLMQVAKMLLKHGCEIDALTTHDHTPLHLAVEYGHLDMVCLLLEAGASPHARDNLQQQPLHLAAGQTKSGAPDLVTALLQQGAPVNDVCARGLTPLDIAVYRDAPLATINALLRAPGAKVSPHDWNNQTALHAAAFLGRQNMVDMLVEHGSRPDARMHLQTGDGLRERAHGFFQGRLGLSSLLALQAAYGMAAREAGSEMDAHVELAALLRLGEVQARVEARSEHTRTGEAVVASAGEAEGAADVFRQAWRRQKGKEGVGAEDAYVAARMRLALTEHSAGVGGSGAVQLEDLCVRLDEAGGLEKAVGVWRAQGVVVFPALIAPHVVAGLRQFVRGVCASTNSASTSSAPPHPVEAVTEATPHRGVVDRSMNIRNPTHRTLRALGVEERPEVLEAIADALGPFLEAALHDSRLLVLEHAVYAIRPGAAAQDWHRDDSVVDSRIASLQVSLVDTALDQGAFEVEPRTHCGSPEHPALDGGGGLDPLDMGVGGEVPCRLAVAVPAGTVMAYSPNVIHRGRANAAADERLVVTTTVVGEHGLIPNGIPLAINPEDEGMWWMADGELRRNRSRGSGT